MEQRDEPVLAATQVRVELRAASLNYRDLLNCDDPERLGIVPLSDGAGEVVEVGSGVADLRPGDRVAGGFFARWTSGPARRADYDSNGPRPRPWPLPADLPAEWPAAASRRAGLC